MAYTDSSNLYDIYNDKLFFDQRRLQTIWIYNIISIERNIKLL